MDAIPFWIWLLASIVVGLVAGVLLHAWWMLKTARARRRIPAYWPLNSRAVANSEERRVWRWLSRAFFDHHVMIKIPVTRFTMPRNKDDGAQWHEMLNAAYCTFTICNSEGRVVGCVDVPGNTGISKSTRVLKQSLLDQCGIGYWVATSSSLPSLDDIRAEFLGPDAAPAESSSPRGASGQQITSAQGSLRAAVEKSRSSRSTSFDPMATDSRLLPHQHDDFDPGSEPNSFLVPLDSRRAELT